LIIIGAVLTLPAIVGTALAIGARSLDATAFEQVFSARPGLALLALVAVGGGLIFLIGLFAYVAVGSSSRLRAERGYGTVGTILACVAVAFFVGTLIPLPVLLPIAQQHPGNPNFVTPGALVLSAVALDAGLIGVLYVRIIHPGVLSWRQIGLVVGPWRVRLLQGVGVGVLTIVGSLLIAAILEHFGVNQNQADLWAGMQGATAPQLLGVYLATAVIAPACEETFFRGYIFTAASRTYGVVPALVLSSLVFAVAHVNLDAFLPILLIGAIFAVTYWKTGSLAPSMIAHFLNNTLFFVLVVFFGSS